MLCIMVSYYNIKNETFKTCIATPPQKICTMVLYTDIDTHLPTYSKPQSLPFPPVNILQSPTPIYSTLIGGMKNISIRSTYLLVDISNFPINKSYYFKIQWKIKSFIPTATCIINLKARLTTGANPLSGFIFATQQYNISKLNPPPTWFELSGIFTYTDGNNSVVCTLETPTNNENYTNFYTDFNKVVTESVSIYITEL